MSDPTPEPTPPTASTQSPAPTFDDEPEPSRIPAMIIGALLALLIGFIAWSTIKQKNPSDAPDPDEFDPTKAAELEIKAARPDGSSSWSKIEVPESPAVSPEFLAKGKALFQKACMGCHGLDGKGEGPVTTKFDLSTTPADLTIPTKSVKLRTTMSGTAPMAEDQFRTITRGLPGTAMWSYRELSAEDRWALVNYIRTFSKEYEEKPGTPVVMPEKIPSSKELLDLGKLAFGGSPGNCHNCHGNDGLGTSSGIYDTMTGKPYPGLRFARANGTRMLSGSSEDDIARTILTGFHLRSPMLSFKASFYSEPNATPEAKAAMDRRFWGLVWYVNDLAHGKPAK